MNKNGKNFLVVVFNFNHDNTPFNNENEEFKYHENPKQREKKWLVCHIS